MKTPGERRPLLVLSGTTASGKDAAGVILARQLDGEIISLDSMKVYRGMDVGTDKPTLAERGGIRHHLLDILDPHETMNLRRYVDLAHQARADIEQRGRLPLVVGGTALYLNGFLRGVFEGPEADVDFRRGLRAEASIRGVSALHDRLQLVDAEAAARIHPRDYKRIERALEVYALTGKPISSLQVQWETPSRIPYRLYLVTWDRSLLDRRINERVDRMLDHGLVDEVRRIVESGGLGPQAGEGLGYRESAAYLKGEITLQEAAELMKRRTRRFARRQLTWFRRMPEARWILAREGDGPEAVAARVLDDYLRGEPEAAGRAGI